MARIVAPIEYIRRADAATRQITAAEWREVG
jgi:hypothetical protein